ncbi:MAG: hypothetical protein J7518_02455 [Nocardioidaceae bacterium]|nr:hypothetical protein [Nocardioidaceae bacterium]
MAMPFLDPDQALLDARFPLPLDAPFTGTMARAAGLHSVELTSLVRRGLVRRLIGNVYVVAQVPDSMELRLAGLRLVVPERAVVTDRTAGWLHGATMVLAPGDHLILPRVSAFHRGRGLRLRNELVSSGQRMMPDEHVMEIGGIRVTTPLRTACDLGRLLRRDSAFAALDAMLRLGAFDQEELLEAIACFKGYRGVRQLRWMAPLSDPRAESPPESILRLRWLDCVRLPRPLPQRPVRAPHWVPGGTYWIDLGVDELRFGVEYDGKDFHGVDRTDHDVRRRRWITEEEGWTLCVVRKENLFGRRADVDDILHAGVVEARRRLGRPGAFI